MAIPVEQIQRNLPKVMVSSPSNNQIESEMVTLPSDNVSKTPLTTTNNNTISSTTISQIKRKSKYDRNARKRSKSFTGSGLSKIMMMNMKPVLPTKFLLGGNINDPLNLNSLQNEDINRAMNAVTPKSSPIPTPPSRKGQIDVIIPPNIHDPLNLIDCADDAEYEQQMWSSSPILRKCRKKRIKKRRTVSTTSIDPESIGGSGGDTEAKTPEAVTDSAKIPPDLVESPEVEKETIKLVEARKEKPLVKRRSDDHVIVTAKKFKHSMDKIVSPVVPQPGSWVQRSSTSVNNREISRRNQTKVTKVLPQFKDTNKRFQFGNYNRYYGYRNIQNETDPRLKVFSHCKYLFEGKDILDIGCNIGHITLSIARDFGAKSVTGIDIDSNLIGIARKNIRHYVNTSISHKTQSNDKVAGGTCSTLNCDQSRTCQICEFFPISMPILYGAVDIPGFNVPSKNIQEARKFPQNVSFKTCNYILEDDTLLGLEQPQFDVILCLSVTKWIHLNWGDIGLKQAFRRMYAQLRPGGRLILEPQNWTSYKTKKKLTETIFKNYNNIEFFPEKFTEYLLSSVVGFAKSEILGCPQHKSNGFRRPVQMFTKSTMFPSERFETTPYVDNNSIRTSDVKTERDNLGLRPPTEEKEEQHLYCTNMLKDRICTTAYSTSENATESYPQLDSTSDRGTFKIDLNARLCDTMDKDSTNNVEENISGKHT